MRNIVIVDYNSPNGWKFHSSLEETTGEKWEVHKEISNLDHGGVFRKLVRYSKYFFVPIKYLRHKNQIARILAWQQFYGLILGFYGRLFNLKNVPPIYVMTFIYKPKKSFVGKVYDKFMRYIVTSGYIKYFVVFSESEKKKRKWKSVLCGMLLWGCFAVIPRVSWKGAVVMAVAVETLSILPCKGNKYNTADEKEKRDEETEQAGSGSKGNCRNFC